MNAHGYHFDISGFDEPLFHVTYEGKDNGHYTWHADKSSVGSATRKLSITVQLSDPADYSGGELELNLAGDPLIAPKERGSVILFPSFCMHRVRPVTKGTRQSLIAWVVGPPLR